MAESDPPASSPRQLIAVAEPSMSKLLDTVKRCLADTGIESRGLLREIRSENLDTDSAFQCSLPGGNALVCSVGEGEAVAAAVANHLASYDVLVFDNFSRFETVGDFANLVETLTSVGTAIRIVAHDIYIDADGSCEDVPGLLFGLDSYGVKLQREETRRDIDQWAENEREYHGGRPPLGFDVEDGELVAAPNYTEVCEVLAKVDAGEMSQQAGARYLDCARHTIVRALEKRRKLYRLPEAT